MAILPENRLGRLRQLGWAGVFFVILAAGLFPAILISAHYRHELSIYEQAVLIAVATVVVQALRRRSLWEVTGRPDGRWLRELVQGCAMGAVLMLVPALLLLAGGWVRFQGAGTAPGALLSATRLMAGVAIAEELLFRGVLFQRLVDALGAWPAQLIVAGLFLLTHLNNPGMTGMTKLWAGTNIFLASVLFGAAWLRTRNLALPIGLHFMANTVQGVLFGFGVSGQSEPRLLQPVFTGAPDWLTGAPFGLEASLPGLLTLIALLLWMLTRQPKA